MTQSMIKVEESQECMFWYGQREWTKTAKIVKFIPTKKAHEKYWSLVGHLDLFLLGSKRYRNLLGKSNTSYVSTL